MATITLGPIVGKVSETTARILIETDKDAEVSCTAIDNEGNAFHVTKKFRKKHL